MIVSVGGGGGGGGEDRSNNFRDVQWNWKRYGERAGGGRDEEREREPW